MLRGDFQRKAAPCPVSRPPDGLARFVGQFLRRTVDVVVEVVNLCACGRGRTERLRAVDPGNRLVAAGLVNVGGIPATALFLQEPHAVPDETGLGEGVAP